MQSTGHDPDPLSTRHESAFSRLGPNGAGKSTTISMLACLLRPTAGASLWVACLGLFIGTISKAEEQVVMWCLIACSSSRRWAAPGSRRFRFE